MLQAGWAQRDITPHVGVHMGGYWGRRSGATAIHDPLSAKLVVWQGPTGAAALVSLDLVAISAERVVRIREEVSTAMAGLDEQAVMVCCSHTHAGPLTLAFRGMGEVDEDYLDHICAAVQACAFEAVKHMEDAQLGYARAPVQIGLNRRQARSGAVVIGENPEGPVAAYAHVVSVQTARGRCILFQHACHPVVLGNDNHEISAEFPGAACAEIEARTGDLAGDLALFINGASGDINPRRTGSTFDDVASLGQELGAAVVAAATNTRPLSGISISAGTRRLDLPLLPPPTGAKAAVDHALQALKVAAKSMGNLWDQRVARAGLEWSQACLKAAQAPDADPSQSFEIQGLRIGELTWLGMEGEIFVRYQLDIESNTAEPIILCGYANGCIGYVPTQQDYALGGYEVDEAYKVYPSVRMIAPQSDGIIRHGVAQLLRELGAATSR